MNKQMHRMITLTAVALLPMLAGCAWVDLEEQAVNVRVASLSQVEACKQLGRTSVSVLDSVAGISRSEEKMAGELETLARNSAVDMNGDTVVAVSKIIDGEQVFNVYRCR